MAYRKTQIDWLYPAIRLLGGPTAAARWLEVSRTTLWQWRTKERPMPVWALKNLAKKLSSEGTELVMLAGELNQGIPAAENRAAQGRAARKAALVRYNNERQLEKFDR